MTLMLIENGKIIDSLSVVPVWTVQNVSSSRNFDTEYTNNTGKTLFVLVSAQCTISVNGGNAQISGRTSGVSFWNNSGIGYGFVDDDIRVQVVLVVPPGDTYSIITSTTNGTVTKFRWIEVY